MACVSMGEREMLASDTLNKEESDKMKTIHIKTIVLGVAFVMTAAGTSRAEPSPDLMNSIHRLRLEAQKRAKADAATSKLAPAGITLWSGFRHGQGRPGRTQTSGMGELYTLSCGDLQRNFQMKRLMNRRLCCCYDHGEIAIVITLTELSLIA